MKRSVWKSFAVYLVIFLLFFSMIEFFNTNTPAEEEPTRVYGENYTEFMENVDKGNVKQVTITTYDNYQTIEGTTIDGETFTMPISKNDDNLAERLADAGVDVTQAETPEPSALMSPAQLAPAGALVGRSVLLLYELDPGWRRQDEPVWQEQGPRHRRQPEPASPLQTWLVLTRSRKNSRKSSTFLRNHRNSNPSVPRSRRACCSLALLGPVKPCSPVQ